MDYEQSSDSGLRKTKTKTKKKKSAKRSRFPRDIVLNPSNINYAQVTETFKKGDYGPYNDEEIEVTAAEVARAIMDEWAQFRK